MRTFRMTPGRGAVALLVAGMVCAPAGLKGAVSGSEHISQLLADCKAEAVELKNDASDMEAFARSNMTWTGYSDKIEQMRTHVNNAGKILARMKDAETGGDPWQQAAIRRIEPLLREMAANMTASINYLREHPSRVHMPEMRDYVKANFDAATDLEALIRDFVSYGESKDKFEKLERKLEL